MNRALRIAGWSLVAGGAIVLLYVVYLLFYTNLQTDRAQAELRTAWEERPVVEAGEDAGEDAGAATEDAVAVPVDVGDAFAVMWFERPGSDTPPVRDGELMVIEGVSLDVLRSGPGHYPESAAPGEEGNFAVAGHRTTHGAPFFHLDELEPGDEIHVVDLMGRHWRYVVRTSMVVAPADVWVVGPDPLGDGEPLMTLTTYHPRFSAAQRLVVFADLDQEVSS
jgi:sortase A